MNNTYLSRSFLSSHFGWRIATIKNGLRDAMAYRGEFVLDLFSSVIVSAGMQLTLWYSAFKIGGITEMGGLGYQELMAYTGVSVLFSQVRGGNYDFQIDEMITTGNLSQYLLRPVGVVEFVYLRSLGEKSAVILLSTLVAMIAAATTSLQADHFLLGMCMAILGNIIHYQIGAVLCVLSFYWEHAFSALMVKNMIVSLFSGELLPLSIFPASWEPFWKAAPFYLYVFGPAQIALGKWAPSEIAHHFLVAGAWIFALNFIIRWSWGFAIRRYQGIGG